MKEMHTGVLSFEVQKIERAVKAASEGDRGELKRQLAMLRSEMREADPSATARPRRRVVTTREEERRFDLLDLTESEFAFIQQAVQGELNNFDFPAEVKAEWSDLLDKIKEANNQPRFVWVESKEEGEIEE